jgi:hypothetical protein
MDWCLEALQLSRRERGNCPSLAPVAALFALLLIACSEKTSGKNELPVVGGSDSRRSDAASFAPACSATGKLGPLHSVEPGALFVRGTMHGDWAVSSEVQMLARADGSYVGRVLAPAGRHQFRIADVGWTNVNCGRSASSPTIALAREAVLDCRVDAANAAFEISFPSCMEFRFLKTGTNATVLVRVVHASESNDWRTDD